VVGATYPEEARILRQHMPRTIFLVPGYGAQGGDAESIVDTFQRDGYGAVINASRSILYAFRNAPPTEPWTKSVRDATVVMRDSVISALKKHGKLPAQW
jgi:orotidine-5'-phosphate decarboxylase